MEAIVGLSAKERERLTELAQVKANRQTLVEAAGRLGISVRQLKRVWKRFVGEGAKGLVHRARGRPSNRSAPITKKREATSASWCKWTDDATGKGHGQFFEQETTQGAMRVLWKWIELYGIPRALYTDHKNVYVAPPRRPTLDEELAGRPALTAFGSWEGRLFQITGPSGRLPRPHEKIVVRRRLDGSRALLWRDQKLEFREIPSRPARPQSPTKPQVPRHSYPAWVPPESHPWKIPFTRAAAEATRQRLMRASSV